MTPSGSTRQVPVRRRSTSEGHEFHGLGVWMDVNPQLGQI